MSTQAAPRAQDSDRAGERVWRTELSPVSFLRRAAEVHADATALVHGAVAGATASSTSASPA